MPKKTDAQAMRSKEWLLTSLIEQMGKNEFTKITISQIADQAQLDRRTFYRHFKTKEEVISFGIQKAAHAYEAVLLKNKIFNSKAIASSFFLACEKNKEFLMLLYKHHLIHLLLLEFNSLFPRYHALYTSEEELNHSNIEASYALAYYIGGFWNILIKWLSDGAQKTSAEMARIVEQLTPDSI